MHPHVDMSMPRKVIEPVSWSLIPPQIIHQTHSSGNLSNQGFLQELPAS